MKCLVIMDPIENIKPHKDTTFAMMLEAKSRDWDVYYCGVHDFSVQEKHVHVSAQCVESLRDKAQDYITLSDVAVQSLNTFDIVLMRKDPPFDMHYNYVTHLLEQSGVRVVNKASSLRDANEKLFTLNFSEYCPVTLISSNIAQLHEFLDAQEEIVCKPLDGMGGASIFRLSAADVNRSVVFETLTNVGTEMIVAQRYIPEIITEGDKRIIMINGEPISHALARVPRAGEFRGNLAAGGTGHVVPLTDREREVCAQVGPVLREKELTFVGLDMIGGFLTEINVTSPTCAREITKGSGVDVCKQFLDAVE